jgi:lipopolysaccharide/colanic/teichoic acid biosynthesis glycosyltransferase
MHCFFLLFVDLLLFALSTVLAVLLCVDLQTPAEVIARVGPYFLLTMAAAPPILLAMGLNRTLWRFTSLDDCVPIAAAATVTVLAAVAAGFAFNRLEGVPRSLPVVQGLFAIYMLGGARVMMRIRHSLRHRARKVGASLDRTRESVLLVGLNPIADLFLRCAAENGQRIEVVGVLSGGNRHRGRLLRSHKILDRPEALETVMHDLAVHGVRVDRVVVATPLHRLSPAAREALGHVASTHNVPVDVLSERYGLSELPPPRSQPAGEAEADDKGAAPAPALDLTALSLRPYLRWKRVIDATGALACIIGLAPLMLLIGIFVMLDVGYPPIFWQRRPGAHGRPIKILKFRTMGPARDEQGRQLTDEERVSFVGRFLRRMRLDELPQVYNVLFGHMSLVGPRPLLPVDQSPASAARLGLRPGLTGWAQIKGGRHLSVHDKAALDLWYVKNASFTLDMLILLSTARMVLFGERVDRHAISEAWRDLGYNPPGMLNAGETSQGAG